MKPLTLPVPMSFQPTERSCTAACAKMVLAFHGLRESYRDLIAELDVRKTRGSTMSRLGTLFLNRGFAVEVIGFEPWFRANLLGLSGDAAKTRLLKAYGNMRCRYDRHLHEYFEKGGRYDIRNVRRNDIVKALRTDTPPILTVSATVLWRTRADEGSHVIVPVGTNRDDIIVHDPYRRYGGRKAYPAERLLHAAYFTGGELMLIRPQ